MVSSIKIDLSSLFYLPGFCRLPTNPVEKNLTDSESELASVTKKRILLFTSKTRSHIFSYEIKVSNKYYVKILAGFGCKKSTPTRLLNMTKFFGPCGFSVVKIRVISSSGLVESVDN